MSGDKKSCQCEECKMACKNKPGWFMPNQIPKLLKFFNVKKISELWKHGFAIDWWEGEPTTYILAPNIIGNENKKYPEDPHGECVFFVNGKCKIHDVKPFECKEYFHSDTFASDRHEFIAQKWGERPELLEGEE